MKKKLLLMLAALLPLVASAETVEIEGIFYELSEDEATVTYNYDDSYSGDIVIPASVTYDGKTYSVTSIGDGVFTECGDLTSITIPETVTYIGAEAFGACYGLTSINIPNGVTSIEPLTFYGCEALTSITIGSGVASIGEGAFSACSSLTSINIPENVEYIGDGAFDGCRDRKSVV